MANRCSKVLNYLMEIGKFGRVLTLGDLEAILYSKQTDNKVVRVHSLK